MARAQFLAAQAWPARPTSIPGGIRAASPREGRAQRRYWELAGAGSTTPLPTKSCSSRIPEASNTLRFSL